MKTLVVCYSKTGTTKKVAGAVVAGKGCDIDDLIYDEKTKEIQCTKDPSEYEHIILLSPVWVFSLAEPMKIYLSRHGSKIRNYDLIVTCAGFGLRGCVKNCLSSIGKPPANSLIFRAKQVQQGNFDLSAIL